MATPDRLDGLHAVIATRVTASGQRYTAGRRTLVELLARSSHPLTMPEILRTDPSLAQSSVYRNLTVLERAGAVSRVITTGEFVCFELAEDLTGHHHHLICADCGTVRDVEIPADVERILDAAFSGLAEAQGFVLHEHRLDLVGRCPDCQSGAAMS